MFEHTSHLSKITLINGMFQNRLVTVDIKVMCRKLNIVHSSRCKKHEMCEFEKVLETGKHRRIGHGFHYRI